MCISHKVGDGRSAFNLFNDWAMASREDSKISSNCDLHYAQDSIFPPSATTPPILSPLSISNNEETSVQTRFVFSLQKLDQLKALVSTVENPTRNEVVSALLFKCVAKANSPFQPWAMTQSFELRQQIGLPSNSIGNIMTAILMLILSEEEMTLSNVVTEMRKGKQQTCNRDNVKDNQLLKQFLKLASEGKTVRTKSPYNVLSITSFVKFPLDEIDFGWGKPAKVSVSNGLGTRLIYLVGNQSGGIDAFVSLSKQEMSIFEHDMELLQYATPLPSF